MSSIGQQSRNLQGPIKSPFEKRPEEPSPEKVSTTSTVNKAIKVTSPVDVGAQKAHDAIQRRAIGVVPVSPEKVINQKMQGSSDSTGESLNSADKVLTRLVSGAKEPPNYPAMNAALVKHLTQLNPSMRVYRSG
ncbi:hypothetical protein DID77_04300 [Candidatus Marinamargulisbacteria bacterium SCGC AG-439-L15]|nr:hypothetical protein DID77_04300 [Candidatus Marinamargulisbacteria bacterium SCGC AG-439-L15]